MIIQIPVENALKHAFVGMEESGEKPLLDVKIWVEDGMLRIDVIARWLWWRRCLGLVWAERRLMLRQARAPGLRILNSTIEMLNAGNPRNCIFRMRSRTG